CAWTGGATGSSRATSRSRASSAGPTSRSAATGPSGGTGRWCAVRSRSAGRDGFTTTLPNRAAPAPGASPAAPRGATATRHRGRTGRQDLVAGGLAGGAGLADPLERAGALLAVVVASAAAPAAATAA